MPSVAHRTDLSTERLLLMSWSCLAESLGKRPPGLCRSLCSLQLSSDNSEVIHVADLDNLRVTRTPGNWLAATQNGEAAAAAD